MRSKRNGENYLRKGSLTSGLHEKDQVEEDLIDFSWYFRVAEECETVKCHLK